MTTRSDLSTPLPAPGPVQGFSKLSKAEKRQWLKQTYFPKDDGLDKELSHFDCLDQETQEAIDHFSENTVANFPMPFGLAPNFLINGRMYTVPMVIEESSVVAAASSAAKYWMKRGGFRAEVIAQEKLGQLHFHWSGSPDRRAALLPALCQYLQVETASLTTRMEARQGGVLGLEWKHLPRVAPDYYQLLVRFGTADSMGANFINTVLEAYGRCLENWIENSDLLSADERHCDIIMAILSNHTPNCVVRSWVSSPIEAMNVAGSGIDAREFAQRFATAVRIAQEDPYRAVTHNKGIMNGVDAVVLATANDFRAIEAAANAYAARDGQYRSLSRCHIDHDQFHFELTLPLALGTVGGLTKLHPLARRSLQMLGNPGSAELMQIIAATGLAQNFAALRSLVTTGIQRGHMKMHLQNILQSLGAQAHERRAATNYFLDKTVSHHAVSQFLEELRRS